MRFMKWAVAIAAASSLMGCNNSQPLVYRVAVDTLSAQNVPNSCYVTAPTIITDKVTNLVDEKQWVVWEGIEDTFYLEPGSINYDMGDARNVSIAAEAIEGTKNDDGEYVFTSVREQIVSDTEKYTTSATYTIEKLDKTLQGSLVLHSTCAGANCGTTLSCDITLSFSGRQIDADRYLNFSSGSGG